MIVTFLLLFCAADGHATFLPDLPIAADERPSGMFETLKESPESTSTGLLKLVPDPNMAHRFRHQVEDLQIDGLAMKDRVGFALVQAMVVGKRTKPTDVHRVGETIVLVSRRKKDATSDCLAQTQYLISRLRHGDDDALFFDDLTADYIRETLGDDAIACGDEEDASPMIIGTAEALTAFLMEHTENDDAWKRSKDAMRPTDRQPPAKREQPKLKISIGEASDE